MTILDCTLRDGGYYNNWDFDPATVRRYINACAVAGIDVVEIGFRFTAKNSFLGPFAYTSDDLLRAIWNVKGPRLAIMVNASDLVDFSGGAEKAIEALFVKKAESRVEMVRIAAHLREVDACKVAAKKLKDLGYTVGLNLMQAAGRSPEALTEIARKVATWNAADVLYFADSMGSMTPSEVKATVKAFRAGWDGPIGIHTHDNCQRAIANSLAAYEAGATWLDSTVLGIGRGAGNARTEYLLSEIESILPGKYKPGALFPLVMEDFQKLLDKYRWGSNLVYYLSAQYGVHPTYSQQMLDDCRYSTEQVLGALESLRDSDSAASYSKHNLRRALTGPMTGSEGSWDATGWAAGRDVLILGAGASVARYRDGLVAYIERKRPLVLSLNVNHSLPLDKITAYVACHKTRLMIEAHEYQNLDSTLIAPRASIPAAIAHQLEEVRLLDYGLFLAEDKFEIGPRGCTMPAALAAPYSMALATAAGAGRILLAGFDGYDAGDPRQSEMVHIFEAYQKLSNKVPVIALTPSTYPVQQSSVYAPAI
ncbi:MAG: aldolase catalytic domain-containing protein [Pseudomonadota bacterium]